MWKEFIICSVILILILVGNYIAQNFTTKSVDQLNLQLDELEALISNENTNEEKVKSKMNEIKDNWNKIYKKLAYYLEHNELEKVAMNLTSLESFVKTSEYADSINELQETKFVLQHIKDKYGIILVNIF